MPYVTPAAPSGPVVNYREILQVVINVPPRVPVLRAGSSPAAYDLVPSGPPTMDVTWLEAFQNPDGTLGPGTGRTARLDASVLASKNPDGSKTFYQNIRDAVYMLLMANGAWPAA